MARNVAGVLLALALSGCTWLYGPKVELPRDVDEAIEKPAIGARALLRMNQIDLELASWEPALQASIDGLRPPLDPTQGEALSAALRRAYGVQRLDDRMATSAPCIAVLSALYSASMSLGSAPADVRFPAAPSQEPPPSE